MQLVLLFVFSFCVLLFSSCLEQLCLDHGLLLLSLCVMRVYELGQRVLFRFRELVFRLLFSLFSFMRFRVSVPVV